MTAGGPVPGGSPRFATTRWSLVVAAGRESTPEGRAALEALCRTYWYPLYAFARRSGERPEDARDLVQGFFADFLERRSLARADPERGRFRSYLLASFRHFAAKERERARAERRGGGRSPLSLDFETGEGRYGLEPVDDCTPERVFERKWALALLDEVLARLAAEHRAMGREDLFRELRGTMVAGAEPVRPYAEIGSRLGMSEGAVKVAVHRMRKRYRDALRAAVLETVTDPGDVDGELRHLLAALG